MTFVLAQCTFPSFGFHRILLHPAQRCARVTRFPLVTLTSSHYTVLRCSLAKIVCVALSRKTFMLLLLNTSGYTPDPDGMIEVVYCALAPVTRSTEYDVV
ncbi:unnamed protein product [Leptosia nina]|uniref:Uncharacterized protein n=1 Tax=Leptosia nina TaxID=320188 RepID=A0AAV1JTI6_9NEOP